jgi:hypothetical protein
MKGRRYIITLKVIREVKKMETEQEYIRNVIDNLLSKKAPKEKEDFYKYLEKVYLEGKKLCKQSE